MYKDSLFRKGFFCLLFLIDLEAFERYVHFPEKNYLIRFKNRLSRMVPESTPSMEYLQQPTRYNTEVYYFYTDKLVLSCRSRFLGMYISQVLLLNSKYVRISRWKVRRTKVVRSFLVFRLDNSSLKPPSKNLTFPIGRPKTFNYGYYIPLAILARTQGF